jgi:hypothetical protein
MLENNYSFIKDGEVVNVVVFNNPSEELLNEFKELHGVDEILAYSINDRLGDVGCTWNGNNYISAQPYPSWVLNEDDLWEAPVPLPEGATGETHYWDEPSLSWQERELPE